MSDTLSGSLMGMQSTLLQAYIEYAKKWLREQGSTPMEMGAPLEASLPRKTLVDASR